MSNKITISFSGFEYKFLMSLGFPPEELRKKIKETILSTFEVPKNESKEIEKYVDGEDLHYIASEEEMQEEFLKVKNSEGSFSHIVDTNKLILHYQPHYYEKEKSLFIDKDIKEKLLSNREKYLNKKREDLSHRELLRGFKISGIYHGFSQHSYYWIKAFINKYKVSSIYDPCGGWGQRLVGAHNIKYIYNDTDEKSVEGAKSITKFLNLKDKYFYNEDASSFTPSEVYDCVFTCPPYFNQEKYGGKLSSTSKYPSYQDWLNVWWRSVIKKSITPSVKYFCFIISPKYLNDMLSVCKYEGLTEIEQIPLGVSTKVDHFHRTNSKSSEKKQEILVVMGVHHG